MAGGMNDQSNREAGRKCGAQKRHGPSRHAVGHSGASRRENHAERANRLRSYPLRKRQHRVNRRRTRSL